MGEPVVLGDPAERSTWETALGLIGGAVWKERVRLERLTANLRRAFEVCR